MATPTPTPSSAGRTNRTHHSRLARLVAAETGTSYNRALDAVRSAAGAALLPAGYGTDLAAFLVFNAQRLGVLYVIWYRQIWLPSSGWRSYSGCCTSSRKHTNHVHLSVY